VAAVVIAVLVNQHLKTVCRSPSTSRGAYAVQSSSGYLTTGRRQSSPRVIYILVTQLRVYDFSAWASYIASLAQLHAQLIIHPCCAACPSRATTLYLHLAQLHRTRTLCIRVALLRVYVFLAWTPYIARHTQIIHPRCTQLRVYCVLPWAPCIALTFNI
jgi:hypothetical protein